MGNIFSSPCSSINNAIEELIYQPPNTDVSCFKELTSSRSKLFCLQTQTGEKETDALLVPGVMVNPINNTNPDKYLVFSHGNASDIYGMYSYFTGVADACNVCVVGYDYVGYGLSLGNKPTEERCYASLEAVMNYLLNKQNIKSEQIYLVGQSLGTGVVADYAHKFQWKQPIILISPYKSICRVVADTFIVSSVDKFETLKKVDGKAAPICCPVKIFHGKDDKLIDVSHAEKIYEGLIDKSLEPVWFDNIGHNDILNVITAEHYNEVLNYVAK